MLTARGRGDQPDPWSLPFHPVLAAAYPVVFLFAMNAAEQVTLEPLWQPLLLAAGGATLLVLALGLLMRDWHRAGMVATVLIIGFFGYGHAWNAAAGILDSQWPLIGAWLLLVVIGLIAAVRAGRFARGANRGLNLVAAILLGLNAWSLGSTMVAFGSVAPPVDELADLQLTPDDPADLPDVYYIVLDRYGGSTALEETYGYDNEPFLTSLEEHGFSVARHAHANYIKTPLSLVSSLNINFLDLDALEAEASSPRDREPIHRALQAPLVVPAALKELGYQYIHVSNWWTPSTSNVDADRTFRYQGQDEFTSVLAQTTFLRAFSDPNAAPDDPWDWPIMRENNLYALDRLDEIPALPGPKYVFAHLVTTHPPYVHDIDGSFTGRAVVAERGDTESYVRQLRYANSRMLSLVDRIIASDPDALIVLGADEGPFPAPYRRSEWAFNWRDATDAQLEEKFGILTAVRVPGADLEAAGFHDAITPVNIFRIIFNARFGTDLELLPDRTWAHENLYRFYEMFEITDRLDRGS
jgi:hypothetical protein